MLRLIRNLLCGLCLVLFLALVVAWPLAHGRPIGIWHKRTKTDLNQEFINSSHYYFFTVDRNQIAIGHWRDPRLVWQIQQSRFTTDVSAAQAAQLQAMLAQLAASGRGVPPGFTSPPLPPPPIHKNFSAPDRFFLADGLHSGPNPKHPWPADPAHTWSHLGISFQGEVTGQVQLHRLTLPIWLPLLLLATPPFLLFRAVYRNYSRRRDNRCLLCGYDLRESPTLCPECGALSTTTTS